MPNILDELGIPHPKEKTNILDELGIAHPAPPETLATPQMAPAQRPITAGGLPQLPPQMPTTPEPTKPSIYEQDWGIWDYNRQYILSQLGKKGIGLGDLAGSAWAQTQNIGNVMRTPLRFVAAAVQEFQQAGEKERPAFAERSFTPTAPFRAIKAGARGAIGIAPDAQTGLAIGRNIVSNMGLKVDEPQWVLENPGQHAVGELLSAWFGTYGTDPIFFAALLSRAKTVLAQRAVQAGKRAVTGAVAEDIPWEKLRPLAEAVGTRKGQKALNQILQLWAREKGMSYGQFRKAVAKIQGMPKEELQRVIAGMGKKATGVPMVPTPGIKAPPTGVPPVPVPVTKPPTVAPVRITEPETIGAHHGQVDLRIIARDTQGKNLGRIEYSEYQGKARVNYIEVKPEYRKKGIGTQLVSALRKEYPDEKINWGISTEEGAKLLEKAGIEAKTIREALEPSPKLPVSAVAEKVPKVKEPWEMTREEYIPVAAKGESVSAKLQWNRLADIHKASVQGAVRRDKPVPAEVLKDYPELVKAKPSPAPAQVEAKAIPQQIDKLHREYQEQMDRILFKASSEGVGMEHPQLEKDFGKLKQLRQEMEKRDRLMGGAPPAEDWHNLMKRAGELGFRDETTGVLNKRGLKSGLSDAITKAEKAKGTVGVIFGDIDRFKQLQDVRGRGHVWGDKALKDYYTIADKIAKKHGGFAARYGGDELTVVLPGKTQDQVAKIAREIKVAVYNRGLAGADATTSLGYANYPENAKTMDDLIGAADASSYAAKQAGGNRVFGVSSTGEHYEIAGDIQKTAKAAKNILKGKPAMSEEEIKAVQEKKVLEILTGKPDMGKATANVLSRISTTPEKAKIPFSGKIEGMYRMAIDELYPLKKYTDIVKKKGIKILAEDDPFILASQHRGWQGKADTYFHHKTFDVDFNWTGRSLNEIYRPINNLRALDEFDAYLVSRRTVELTKRGIKTGIPLKDAEGAISELEQKYPPFNSVAKELYDYQDQLLKYVFDSQLIDKEAFQNMKRLNRQYVPFFRVMEMAQGKGLLGKGVVNLPKVVKRIKGSGREIISPSESIVKNTYAMIDAAERNQVALALTRLAKNHPQELAGFIQKVPTKIAKVAQVSMKEIQAKLKEELGLSDQLAGSVVDIFRPSILAPKANIITVMENGKRTFYEVDPDVYKSLTALDREGMNMLVKLLSYPARWLRLGAVTLSPEFAVRNPVRDAFSAFVYSKYGFLPGLDTWRGLFSVLKHDELYWRWKMSGAEHSMLVSLDRAYLQQTQKDVMGGKARKLENIVKHPVEAAAILAELGEEATRIGEFKLGFGGGKRWWLMAEGMADDIPLKSKVLEAGNAAREVTLDFARLGAKTKSVNQIIAFWNANVQDMDKIRRSFVKYPIRTLAKAIAGIAIPSVALYLAQKDDPRYKEIPQWQKDIFWIVLTPKTIWRIPKPFTLGILFGTVPERILEYVEKNDPKVFKELAESAQRSMSPGILPTAFQAPIEVATNYSMFLDRPIVPPSKKRLPPELQYSVYTPETAKLIGKVLGVSPLKVQHFIRGYSGGFGALTMETIDQIMRSVDTGKKPARPQRSMADVPVLRGFVVREPIGSASESLNRFYELYEKAQAGNAAIEDAQKKGDSEAARKYQKKYPEAKYIKPLRKVAAKLSKGRKKRINIWDDKTLSSQEKRQQIRAIEQKITEIAREALEAVKKTKKEGTQ